MGTYGSAGAAGGQLPAATRPVTLSPSEGQVTIFDNDITTTYLEHESIDVGEGVGSVEIRQILGPKQVEYSFTSIHLAQEGEAKNDSDFDEYSRPVIFEALATYGSTWLDVVDDDLPEGYEKLDDLDFSVEALSVTLLRNGVDPDDITILNSRTQVNIRDDDPAFYVPSGIEGKGAVDVPIKLSYPVPREVSIDYRVMSGETAVVSGTAVFPMESTESIVAVPSTLGLKDGIVLSNPSAGRIYDPGAADPEAELIADEFEFAVSIVGGAELSALALTDPDDANVGYALAPAFDAAVDTYTAAVPNGVDAVELSATASDSGASVSIANDDDTGTADEAVLDLTVGSSNVLSVTVTAADPATVETYTVTVTRAAGPPGRVTGLAVTPGDGRLAAVWEEVADATGYKVQWKSGSETFADAATDSREAVIASGATTGHTITGLSNGTAYTVRVIATKTGAADGPASEEVTETPSLPELTIGDATATEGSAVAFTVTLSRAASSSVTVMYSAAVEAGDTATLDASAPGGADFTAASGTLTVTAGSTTGTVSIATAGDTTHEDDETFTVTLTSPAGATLAGASKAQGTIVDDDSPPAVEVPGDVSVTEGAGVTAPLAVGLSAAAGRTATVDWATADESAVAGSDYTAASGTLTFDPGVTSMTITVAILDDGVPEPQESLDVILSNAASATLPAHATVAVTIGNDDGTAATGKPAISGTAQARETLTASPGTIMDDDGLINVAYSYQWVRVAGSVETDIPSATGSTYVVLTADVGNRVKVRVSFNDNAGNAEALTSDAWPQIGTIAASVALEVGWEETDYDYAEDAGSPEIAMVLHSGDPVGNASIAADLVLEPITANDDPADGNQDYVWGVESTPLVIPPGETSAVYAVQILDDDLVENIERFRVRLTNVRFVPEAGAVLDPGLTVTLSPSEGQVSILDNDITNTWLEHESIDVGEGVGSVEIRQIVGPEGVEYAFVTVHLAISGEAVGGTDYYAPHNDFVEFAALATDSSSWLEVVDDDLPEGYEDLNDLDFSVEALSVTLLRNGLDLDDVNLLNTKTQVNITDDDPAFYVPSGIEGKGAVDVPIKLSYPVPREVSIDYRVMSGETAVVSGTAVFAIGSTEFIVAVPSTLGLKDGIVLSNPSAGRIYDPGAALQSVELIADEFEFAVSIVGGAELSALALTDTHGSTIDLTPAMFDPVTLAYTASVANGVASVTVTPALGDGNAAVAYMPADSDLMSAGHQVALSVGVNTIEVEVTAEDGNSTATYTVTVTRALGQVTGVALTVGSGQLKVDWTAVTGADGYKVQWRSGGETFAAASAEGREAVIASGTTTTHTITGLANGTAYTVRVMATKAGLADGPASGEETQTPALPELTIEDATATEGTGVAFTVTLSRAAADEVTVEYTTSDGTGVGGAEAGTDYTAASGLTLTFGASTTSATLTIATTPDTTDENDETFTVTLASPSTNAKLGSAQTATGTIVDDDGTPTVSIEDAMAEEGVAVEFTVNLSHASSGEVTVQYTTSNGTAMAGDYTAAVNQTLSIDAGATSATLTIATTEDTEDEEDETFTVTLASPSSNAELGARRTATGTIVDDDLSADATLSALALTDPDDANVGYALTPAFDAAIDTYTASVASGVTAVTVTPELADENATFSYVPSVDSDTGSEGHQVALLVGENPIEVEVTAEDGNSTETYTVTVTRALGQVTGVLLTVGAGQLKVDWSTVTGADGYKVQWKSGMETFAAASAEGREAVIGSGTTTTHTIIDLANATAYTVRVIATKAGLADGPASAEATETTLALPELTIEDATATEGSAVAFTVTLSRAVAGDVTVEYSATVEAGDTATLDASAPGGADFTAASGTLTVTAGSTAGTVSIATAGDTTHEDDETFTVTLSSPSSNAELGTPNVATGTIVDDEGTPTLTIEPAATAAEGDDVEFTVTLSPASSGEVTVQYTTSNGTASSSDYTAAVNRTLSITAGATSATLTIATTEDTEDEEAETFTVTLATPSSNAALGARKTATGTITDDDTAGVTVSKSTLAVTEQDTTGDTYTVVLDTQPTADVTVTVGGHAGTVTATPASLTFTTLNWDTAQTVKVTAGNDANTANETINLTHTATSTDTDYSGITIAGVDVTVNDNDTANHPPVFANATQTRTLAETVGDATVQTAAAIGDAVTATDDDAGDTLGYTLGGTDPDKFTFDTSSGQISTKAGESYDYEAKASYAVTVTASDGNGGAAIADVTINVEDNTTEKPLAPTAPVVTPTAQSTTSLDVSWSAPDDTGRPASTSYDLRYRYVSGWTDGPRGVSGTSGWTDGPRDVSGTSASISGLEQNTEYAVQVRAHNDDGYGARSKGGRGTTAVTSVAVDFERASYAVAEGRNINVKVRLRTDPKRTVTIPLTKTDQNGADAGDYLVATSLVVFNAGDTERTFNFMAAEDSVDDDGESVKLGFGALPTGVTAGRTPEATVTITDTDTATARVMGVTVAPGNAKLVVTWTAVDNATGYRVQWKSGSQDYDPTRQATVTSGSTTSYTIGGLANGTAYTVQVIATRTGANDGPPSAQATGTPEEELAAAGISLCDAWLDAGEPVWRQADLAICWDVEGAFGTGSDTVIEWQWRSFWGENNENPWFPWSEVARGDTYMHCSGRDASCVKHVLRELFRGYSFTYRMRIRVGNSTAFESPELEAQAPNSNATGLIPQISGGFLPDTVELVDVPTGAFWFDLNFRDSDPVASVLMVEPVRGLEAADLVVTNATATVELSTHDGYKVTLTPMTLGEDVTVQLPANKVKGVGEGITASGGNNYTRDNVASNTMTWQTAPPANPQVSEPPGAPLAAGFVSVPAEHDGSSAFWLELSFDAAVAQGSKPHIRALLGVTGGSVTRVRRKDDRLDHWRVRVEPSSHEAVTVTLSPSPACGETGAVCTQDGRTFTTALATRIHGPPALSVADAEAQEGPNAVLAFAVTLDRTPSGTVTVDYATSDGTATAGSDYTATSGTVTFAAGEMEKTVSVPVLDDAHDEGSESLTLTLSNPSGAHVVDGSATGTINNSDYMPRAWLARFGRTVADQVLDAVQGRMTASRVAGTELSLAGRRIGGAGASDALETRGSGARWEAPAHWLWDEEEDGSEAFGSRQVTGREFLTGSSFALTGGTAEDGYGALWGRGAVSRFNGREGDRTLDGEVASAMFGADWTRDGAAAGLALVHSYGDGGYRSPAGDGEVESGLTGVYPWGRYEVSERLAVWGVAGYGEGTLTLTPAGHSPIETDMGLAMGAVGGRAIVVKAPADGGLELAATSDALMLRMSSDEVRGSATQSLAASQADVTRFRLGLEGTWRGLATQGGGSFVPSLEVGVRHDGGDAETGFGVDIGAGLAWRDRSLGIEAEVRARGLLTHEDGSFRERGIAGSLAWDPDPSSERGTKLTLSQTMGAEASGGMDALLRPGTSRVPGAANDAGEELRKRRLEAKLGHGFAVLDGRYTGTPEFGLGLTQTSREYILGWRLSQAPRPGLVFGLDVEGARRETLGGDDEPEHRLGLGLGWRLEGAPHGDLAFRFEASRLDPADDAAEHRIGFTVTAHW